MTYKIEIPSDPVPDGYQILYWTFNNSREGLIHIRLTYIENRTHAEVTGEADACGADWIKDWRCESRYVPSSEPGEPIRDEAAIAEARKNGNLYRGQLAWVTVPASPWNTNGRNSTENIRRANSLPDPTCFATYREAQAALVAWIEERIAARIKTNAHDRRIIERMSKLDEPAP